MSYLNGSKGENKMNTYNHNGIVFDDVIVNTDEDYSGEMWSQMCGKCQHQHSDKVVGLLDDNGSGICGVKDCWNEDESVVYIDFPVKENNN